MAAVSVAYVLPPRSAPCTGQCPQARHRSKCRQWRLQAASRQSQCQAQSFQWQLDVQRGYIPDAVQISKLLAEAFLSTDGLDGEDSEPLSGSQQLAYQLKLLAALQWRASTLGRGFVTVMATDSASGELAGVANVAPGVALADAEDHLKLGAGQVAATISNMAVAERFRRRGLGRLLLAACEDAAAQYSPPATLMALAVYRYNEPAIQLYRSSGYHLDEGWVDQRWADSAERGQVGFARRQLMLKPLQGRSSCSINGGGSSGGGSLPHT